MKENIPPLCGVGLNGLMIACWHKAEKGSVFVCGLAFVFPSQQLTILPALMGRQNEWLCLVQKKIKNNFHRFVVKYCSLIYAIAL